MSPPPPPPTVKVEGPFAGAGAAPCARSVSPNRCWSSARCWSTFWSCCKSLSRLRASSLFPFGSAARPSSGPSSSSLTAAGSPRAAGQPSGRSSCKSSSRRRASSLWTCACAAQAPRAARPPCPHARLPPESAWPQARAWEKFIRVNGG